MELNPQFWKGKKVLLTGHTGFKGTWAYVLLRQLGAHVFGYSLPPDESNILYNLTIERCDNHSTFEDIRNLDKLKEFVASVEPEIILHFAAQPLVMDSYRYPVDTFSTNVMGTVNLCESLKEVESWSTALFITTDKVYENRNHCWPFRENDRLGGGDPYSSSKSCSELVVQAYAKSYFHKGQGRKLATARAGNVIGGGDFSKERLMPDVFRSYGNRDKLVIRKGDAIRPWQFVLEPVAGYLEFVESLSSTSLNLPSLNFGPPYESFVPVRSLLQKVNRLLENELDFEELEEHSGLMKETTKLKLDWSLANDSIGWCPKIDLDKTLELTCRWYIAYYRSEDVDTLTEKQVADYIQAYS